MSFATISGALIDSDTTPWIKALWSVIAVSPSSPPVFSDGTPVLPVFGQLDTTANFSGSIPRTDSILPAGTTLTITVYSVTSAPPSIIENVVVTTPTINLGALLSPLIKAPRIQSAPIAYAYSQTELINPTHGDGFVNTSDNLAFVFVGDTWEELNSGPGEQIYPPAGIAVSTGSAWAASLNPGALPAPGTDFQVLVNEGGAIIAAPTTFEGNNGNVPGELTVGSLTSSGNVQIDGTLGVVNGVLFNGTLSGNAGSFSGNVGAATLSSTGNTNVGGGLTVTGNTTTGTLTTTGNAQVNGALGVATGLTVSAAATITGALSVGGGGTQVDGTHMTLGFAGMQIGEKAGSPFGTTYELRVDNSIPRSFIDAWGDLYINQGRTAASVNVNGTLNATTKNFRIEHPLEPEKWLFHSSLEGPETAVIYRGEAQTVDGRVTITMPDYFEALTRPDGRSVQLTIKVDDANPVFGGQIAAGTVANGEFNVYSADSSTAFYWEVKAVRADVVPLEVVVPMQEVDIRRNNE